MKSILSILICLTFLLPVAADEGMWLPMLIKRLNIEDMQKKGLKLTAEEIYSINQASLKDATAVRVYSILLNKYIFLKIHKRYLYAKTKLIQYI